jgi:hypothetical protein
MEEESAGRVRDSFDFSRRIQQLQRFKVNWKGMDRVLLPYIYSLERENAYDFVKETGRFLYFFFVRGYNIQRL